MSNLPSGTVTFLFTDIEGSTALWERDRAAMRAAVDRQLAILQSLIAAHHGVLYKTTGDGTQAAFASAEDALRAAVAAQRALLRETWTDPLGPLRVRMALHAGEAAPDAHGDYLAAPLNRLSRLLAAGHGSQILLAQTVQQLTRGARPAGAELRDLGDHRLRDLLEPEHVFQLLHQDLPDQFPPLKSLESRPNNLPRQPTPFMGREREIREVVSLLERDDLQLLTLTGPGGTGKTRLALQAAADLLDEFADGVFIVALAPLSDPDLVPSTIAETLGMRDEGGKPLRERLRDHLGTKQLLLVLDNLEHLSAAASVVAELLGASPGLKVLTTSRMPLRLRAEREYAVPPLGLPRRKPPPTLEQLSQFEAVRLFIERAQAVKSNFAIDNESAPAVAEICWRLDGLPLAIELAAARVRMLPPQAMLSRLEQRLPMLTGGARDAPERQRTLRNTIAWSYDLLEPAEQQVFRHLAVFSGGMTLESAEAVANPDGGLDTFASLEWLVEHSLLRQEAGTGGEPRFSMLETIREFGGERLAASGEETTVQSRHVAYFLALAEHNRLDTRVHELKHRLDRLQADLPNLRAAMAWALDHDDATTGLRIAATLGRFWEARGLLEEGRAWLERALAASEVVDPSVRANALTALGSLVLGVGEYASATRYLEEALALYRELGDVGGAGWPLVSLGAIAMFEGDFARDEALTREAVAAFRASGDDVGVGMTLANLASTLSERGDPDEAEALATEALALLRRLGHESAASMALAVLSEVAITR